MTSDSSPVPTLEARGISRRFGSRLAVHETDLTLHRGEVLGLLGPNGAGKTTTMRMLTGNLAPSSGRIRVCGSDLVEEPVRAKRHLGYLPEQPPLYRDMSVDGYLALVGRLRRVPSTQASAARERAKRRCGLADIGSRPLGSLSKGYQQRVGIAQAILHDPDVVVLDEPTSGLDPNQIREIRSLIRELARAHSVILSTHILSEAEAVCDRVHIMHHGRFVYGAATAELDLAARSRALHVALRRPPAIERLREVVGGNAVEETGAGTFRIAWVPDSDPTDSLVATAVREDWGLFELGPARSRLEDVFVELTRGDAS